MIETLNRAARKARKQHHCSMCGRVIDPGETYDCSTNIYDGNLYTWKQCRHCDAMVQILKLHDWAGYPDEGIGPDDVGEFEPETIAQARIIIGWRGKWRRKDGTLREVPAREPEEPTSEPHRIDVTHVAPGELERMARSGARPSPELRAAIDRARDRKGTDRG